MECPKCHTQIGEKETVCPKCHKVLLLECPNCHSLEESAVCTNCGYKILIKCSKCGRINPAINDLCVKCGFPTKTSLAYQECESDEFASVTIKFNNLKSIKRILKSKDLYEKFFFKLKNLVLAQIRNVEGLFITYGDSFVLNFNKELSLPTSSNKAVRFALKLANALTQLNTNVVEELKIPLGLNIIISKKEAENLQELHSYENNVKLLNVKKGLPKYLKGTQIILDQHVWDEVNKEYRTDSLYSMEENGKSTMFYEIVLDSYILPPSNDTDENTLDIIQHQIKKVKNNTESDSTNSKAFKVFNIKAKCSFQITNALEIPEKLANIDFEKSGKIISVRSVPECMADTNDIREACMKKGYKVFTITCTEELNYKPWGFFEILFRKYFGIQSYGNTSLESINQNHLETFKPLFDLCSGNIISASSPEDARFAYIELWGKFLALLSKTVIIIDGLENIDDTSIQTLEIYFDNFKKIKPNFIFLTSDEISLHSKIKGLLRTESYTEFRLTKTSFSNCLSTIKADAADFIGSFYFEKLQEHFNGSYLYFKNVMKYLTETGVLINFENKLLVKKTKSVVVPKDLFSSFKARMKHLGKNQDIFLILAYSAMLYSNIDIQNLKNLGIQDAENNIKILADSGFVHQEDNYLVINNYNLYKQTILSSMKKEAETMLAQNIINKIGTYIDNVTFALLLGKIGCFKEEYEKLCLCAEFSIKSGDYDAYLKNCLGFLSLIESVDLNIEAEKIETNKTKVYDSILKYLYKYAPSKIYFIENILLTDSIKENDNEKVVKLSNMMLQGALISSNYSNALELLHNILSGMQNPTLLVNGAINTKFLLLSLVHIEILYNIGKYKECTDTATELLSVLKIEIIDKIKPASFSVNSFVSHILETMRYAAFAKLYMMDENLENFLDLITITLDTDLPEKDCILAIRDFLAGKVYNTGIIEAYAPFSKIVFLILQEIAHLLTNGDYQRFAQNIYQAKLLAEDINHTEIKYFCDLLIGYAYSKIGITEKAKAIYNDVIMQSENNALFNINIIAKYFLANLQSNPEDALLIINQAYKAIGQNNNQALILYVLFKKLYIEIMRKNELTAANIQAEEQELEQYKESLKLIVG